MKLSTASKVAGGLFIAALSTELADAYEVKMVKDMSPGFLESTKPRSLHVCNDYLYFRTPSGYFSDPDYYKYDGASGNITVDDEYPKEMKRGICFKNEIYYFDAVPQEKECDDYGCSWENLWGVYKYDGSNKTVVYDTKIKSLYSDTQLFEYQDELYFGIEGPKLMKLTGDGAEAVCDLQTGWNPLENVPKQMYEHNGRLYFMAKDEDDNNGLYKYDKDEGCSLQVGFGNRYLHWILSFKGHLYLYVQLKIGVGSKNDLWKGVLKLEGDEGDKFTGTQNLIEETRNMEIEEVVEYGNNVYFLVDDNDQPNSWFGRNFKSLWKHDGETTTRFDNNIFGSDTDFEQLTPFDGKLFFVASDGTIPDKSVGLTEQLWTWDGEGDATVVQSTFPFEPTELTPYQGQLYFAASGDRTGNELWVYTPDDYENPSLKSGTPPEDVGGLSPTNEGTVDYNKAEGNDNEEDQALSTTEDNGDDESMPAQYMVVGNIYEELDEIVEDMIEEQEDFHYDYDNSGTLEELEESPSELNYNYDDIEDSLSDILKYDFDDSGAIMMAGPNMFLFFPFFMLMVLLSF